MMNIKATQPIFYTCLLICFVAFGYFGKELIVPSTSHESAPVYAAVGDFCDFDAVNGPNGNTPCPAGEWCDFSQGTGPENGQCILDCGNGICEDTEDHITCSQDCAEPSLCGNGTCDSAQGENPVNCSEDCPSTCGDNTCDSWESANSCYADCGVCGDGACAASEGAGGANECFTDCPCGDGVCDEAGGESYLSCETDCNTCGIDADNDGDLCDPGEFVISNNGETLTIFCADCVEEGDGVCSSDFGEHLSGSIDCPCNLDGQCSEEEWFAGNLGSTMFDTESNAHRCNDCSVYTCNNDNICDNEGGNGLENCGCSDCGETIRNPDFPAQQHETCNEQYPPENQDSCDIGEGNCPGGDCPGETIPSDVFFVIDVSSSMTEGTKIDTAKRLLISIIDSLPVGSRASMITFNNTATVDTALTTFLDDIKDDFEGLENYIPDTGALTNYVDAYDELLFHVAGNQSSFPGRNQLVVFLSDGEPTLGSPDENCQTNAHVNDPADTCQFDAAEDAANNFALIFPNIEIQAYGIDAVSSDFPTETVDILENFVASTPAHYTEVDSTEAYIPDGSGGTMLDPAYCATTSDFDVYQDTFCPAVCEPEDGTCGGANGVTYAHDDTDYAPDEQCGEGNGIPSNSSFPNQGQTITWTCGGGAGGTDSPTCTASRDTAPSCGTADQTYPNGTTTFSGTFCEEGTPTPANPVFPTEGNAVTWTCSSPNGGSSVSCTAEHLGPDPVNGVCGTANGQEYTFDRTEYTPDFQCSSGISSNTTFPAQGETETRLCQGSNGGTTATLCSASRNEPPVIVEPVCGSANQIYPNGTTGYGSDEFCEEGTPTPTNPSFPTPGNTVTWTCNQGGLSVSCEAGQVGLNQIDGQCGSIITPGVYYGQNLFPAPTNEFCRGGVNQVQNFMGPNTDGVYSWNCLGYNGGVIVACAIEENRCGDGIVQNTEGEECDDGDTLDGNGCSSTCEYEMPTCVGFSVTPESGLVGVTATATVPNQSGFGYSNLNRGDGSAIIGTPALPEDYTYTTVGTFSISLVASNILPGASSYVSTITCTDQIEVSALPEDGICGGAAVTYPNGTTAFSGTFCEGGTMNPTSVSFPGAGTSVQWNCEGVDGGNTAVCIATQAPATPQDGTCGGANGQTYPASQTTYGIDQQCVTGNPSNSSFPSQGQSVTRTCDSINGGASSNTCSASRLTPTPENGLCGTINGNDYYGQNIFVTPLASFCEGGVDQVTNFQGPNSQGVYTWNCLGSNGGATSIGCSVEEHRCGDGIDNGTIQYENGLAMEQCDDANAINDDTCSNNCTDVIIVTPPNDIYDLALTKTLAGSQTVFYEGDGVTFEITIINQGTEYAGGISLIDYVPEGLTLNDESWTESTQGEAIYTYVGQLQPGERDTVSISFTITDDNLTIRNRAEILSDDGNDVDSNPDQNNTDCFYEVNGNTSSDDYELGMGSSVLCSTINGDEDDHDRADIAVRRNRSLSGGSSSSITPTDLIIPPAPVPVIVQPEIVPTPVVVEPEPEIISEPLPVDPLMYTYIDNVKDEKIQGPGDHYFYEEPEYLQTGMSIEDGKIQYGIGVRRDYRVVTDAPTRGVAHDSNNYPKDLQYWLDNVLLPYDANAGNAGMYVLLPEAGYLIPINQLDESDATYQKMLRGENVDVIAELQDDFAKGVLHHAGTVKPGQFGRSVVAMHSSRWKEKSGVYTEGKYPTIGQLIAGLLPGDEVIYYVKNATGGYDHHIYMVNGIKEVDPSQISDLYPARGYEAMLYTCTDFGVSDNRLLATMEYISGDRQEIDFGITPNQRALIDATFDGIYNQKNDIEVIATALTKVRNKIKIMEENDEIGLFIKEPVRYIKWNISNTLRGLEGSNYDLLGY